MKPSSLPHVLTCGALLGISDVALRTLGLRRSVALARRVARGPKPAAADASRRTVMATARRVATAAAFYPGRAQCLEQSLALFVLLRRRGVPAELKVGVRTFPFTAHAWVEHDGHAVNEVDDFVTSLAPFPNLGG